jgi:hypothetical protein
MAASLLNCQRFNILFCTIPLVAPGQSLFAVPRVAFDLISAPFGLSCRHNSALSCCALGAFSNIKQIMCYKTEAQGRAFDGNEVSTFGCRCSRLPESARHDSI